MIPAGVQVFVAVEPVNLRLGFERLAGLVRERVGYERIRGGRFVFFGKRRETVEVVFVDGRGRCPFHKRLRRGVFARIEVLELGAGHLEVDLAAFDARLDKDPLAKPLGSLTVPAEQQAPPR